MNMNQEQLLSTQIYYKYQNNLGFSEDAPINIQWWKETSITDMVTQSDFQHDAISSTNNSLTNYFLPNEPTNARFSNSSEKAAIPTRSKQLKRSKIVNDKESLRRTKHPELWKVNIKKTARLRGEEYIGVGGKIVPAKIMGPPCKCRMRCTEKVNEMARKELHNFFWKTFNWEQRKQCVALSVKESPKQRTRCRGNVKSGHRRQVTFTYSLLLNGEFITVCKCMFLSTFALSEKFVRHVMDKKRISPEGIIGPDQRGKHSPKTKKTENVKDRVREHIKSFPTEKSTDPLNCTGKRYLDSKLSIVAMHKLYISKCKAEGVPDSDIVKESYYREMFKTEFTLGFK
ncbi:uncharacterized protein LOC143425099 [Xylocopa sonorina]|uniref:uncharacterized protein LOC143425099 n=1 Tax=Xylocopa sonorina TaxID=1818115 RepID=UPI00403AE24E